MVVAYPGNHGDAPQLLGDQALHDPLEGLLHLDQVVPVHSDALLSETGEKNNKPVIPPEARPNEKN